MMVASGTTITLLTEDFQYGVTNGDMNVDAALHELVGYGLNNDNPTTLLGAGTGGNVRTDQPGFGGNYGTGDNAGNGVRVRSSNGALLNADPLAAAGAQTITFSFDIKENTANYVQVIEFSFDQAFTAPILLDTFDGNTAADLGVWRPRSYTLTNGVDATFTDDAYFRIRKLRPSPGGTNGGANSTFHVYDNISVTAVIPEPSAVLLGAFGFLFVLRRRR